jgi:glycosyltransferase involved in cell wall biosynthesis
MYLNIQLPKEFQRVAFQLVNTMTAYKIAIIGNMNGNGSALASNLASLGYDVTLILYANDGVGSLKHFGVPKNNGKFKVTMMPIYNSHYTSISLWLQYIAYIKVFIHCLRHGQLLFLPLPAIRRSYVESKLNNYDRIVCSGIIISYLPYLNTPAIWTPYSIGGEYLFAPEYFFNQSKSLRSLLSIRLKKVAQAKQLIGAIKASHVCIASDCGPDLRLKSEIDNTLIMRIPMVDELAKRERNKIYRQRIEYFKTLEKGEKQPIRLLHYSRLHYVLPSRLDSLSWFLENKQNDLVLFALRRLIDTLGDFNISLTVLKYGKDIRAFESLVRSLSLELHVKFLSAISHDKILKLHYNHHICLGEFYREPTSPGGVTWECCSTGMPLLQSPISYRADSNRGLASIPPLRTCSTEEDIYLSLKELILNPCELLSYSRCLYNWYQHDSSENLSAFASLLMT